MIFNFLNLNTLPLLFSILSILLFIFRFNVWVVSVFLFAIILFLFDWRNSIRKKRTRCVLTYLIIILFRNRTKRNRNFNMLHIHTLHNSRTTYTIHTYDVKHICCALIYCFRILRSLDVLTCWFIHTQSKQSAIAHWLLIDSQIYGCII